MRILIIFIFLINYSFSQRDSIFTILDEKAKTSNEDYFLWNSIFNKYANKWIKHDIRFDNDSLKMSCIVETSGKLTNCNVIYSTDENLTKLVLIVNNKHKYWSPGKINGVAVRSRQEIKMQIGPAR